MPTSSVTERRLKPRLGRMDISLPLLKNVFLLWLATRVGYALVTYFATTLHLYQAPPHSLGLTMGWQRWDANWYLLISRAGYFSKQSVNFFPLYPMTLGAVSWVLGDGSGPVFPQPDNLRLAIGMVLSNLGLLVGLYGVGRLAQLDNEPSDGDAGSQAVRLALAYPFAMAWTIAYTEGFFFAFAALTLLFARRGRWYAAAATAFLAALTRPIAVVLVLPLAWEYALQLSWRQRIGWRSLPDLPALFRRLPRPSLPDLPALLRRLPRPSLPDLPTLLRRLPRPALPDLPALFQRLPRPSLPDRAARFRRLPRPSLRGLPVLLGVLARGLLVLLRGTLLVSAVPAGLATYFTYVYWRYGDFLLPMHTQFTYWQHVSMPQWQTFSIALSRIAHQPQKNILALEVALFALYTLLMVFNIRRLPFMYTLYMAGLLYMTTAAPVPTRPDLLWGTSRYLCQAIPIYVLVAGWAVRRRWLDGTLLGIGLMLQGIFTVALFQNRPIL